MQFTTSTLTTLAAVLSLANPIFASKVDCSSSAFIDCKLASRRTAQKLTEYINFIDPARFYQYDEFIACYTSVFLGIPESVCAFPERLAGISGSAIRKVAHYIPEGGCRVCGSVPFDYPKGTGGLLRYNSVIQDPCDDGLCPRRVQEGVKEE